MRKLNGATPWTLAVQLALWLALFGAMAGSLQHVAWSFATLSGGDMLSGYVQAVAVDIGIAALAFGVQIRKVTRRQTFGIWIGVIVFSLVSTYANLLYGLAHISDIGIGWLAQLRPYIMSAVLPLMVVYLSEVVSEDVQHAVSEAEKLRKREARDPVSGPGIDAPAAEDADMSKEQAVQATLTALTATPDISVSKLARNIGRSRGSVYNYLDELERQGMISRRDDGSVTVHANGSKAAV